MMIPQTDDLLVFLLILTFPRVKVIHKMSALPCPVVMVPKPKLVFLEDVRGNWVRKEFIPPFVWKAIAPGAILHSENTISRDPNSAEFSFCFSELSLEPVK